MGVTRFQCGWPAGRWCQIRDKETTVGQGLYSPLGLVQCSLPGRAQTPIGGEKRQGRGSRPKPSKFPSNRVKIRYLPRSGPKWSCEKPPTTGVRPVTASGSPGPRSWEKISRSALPYYLKVSDPAVRVRRAWACPSLWADNGGLGFISSTVYLCPVRRVHAFALADNAGRYWITPEWTACGPLFHRFPEGHTDVQGNPLIVDTFHMTADGEEGRPHYGHQLPLTQEMFEGWTFHEKARATHEAMERYRGYYNEEGSAVFPRDGNPYSDDKSDFTYLDPRLGSIGYWMARASVVWVFDREHGAGALGRSGGSGAPAKC